MVVLVTFVLSKGREVYRIFCEKISRPFFTFYNSIKSAQILGEKFLKIREVADAMDRAFRSLG